MKKCNQCGKCCVKYGGGGLSATAAEIAHWERSYPHIFRYVEAGKIWVDPESGTELQQCPWLRKEVHSERYLCEIYFARPNDCRQYPSLIDDMIRDACEMLESKDLKNRAQANRALEQIMSESRE